jgi:hypothetical protein
MNRFLASSAVLAAAVIAASPVRADGLAASFPDVAPRSGLQQTTTSGFSNMDTSNGPLRRFGWAGIGYYNAASEGFLGFNAGGALDLAVVAPDLPLGVFGNVAIAFGSDVILPITVGGEVHYDKLPVQLLGGAGFTLMPHSGGGSTAAGLALMGMASYALPQIRQGAAAMAQVQYHFMSAGFSLFVLDVGITMAF